MKEKIQVVQFGHQASGTGIYSEHEVQMFIVSLGPPMKEPSSFGRFFHWRYLVEI